jgi:hypothetical protein
MTDPTEDPLRSSDGDEIVFLAAGDNAKGEFRCAECGYGVAVCRELPVCPMCSCEVWEASSWHPFGRALGSGHRQ